MNKFEMLQKLHVSKELKQRVENTVLHYLDIAQKKFGADKCQKIPEIRFDTKGRSAGLAFWNYGKPWVNFNPVLLNENTESMLKQTVPHEVAHVVVAEVYRSEEPDPWNFKRIAPHGHEWQHVMRVFGLDPRRCHNMDVSTIRIIRNGGIEFHYNCGCTTHKLTKIKHNRLQNGAVYTCRKCKQPLKFDKILSF